MDTKTCRLSVDVETGGGNPFDYPLLEVGMCVVGEESLGFECMFVPEPMHFDRDALKAIKCPIEEFVVQGVPLTIGINRMLDWIDTVAVGRVVEIKGLNSAFDWMFLMYSVTKVRARHTLPYRVEEIGSFGVGVFHEPLFAHGDGWIIKKIQEKVPDLIGKYGLLKQNDRKHTGLDDARRQSRLICALEEYITRSSLNPSL